MSRLETWGRAIKTQIQKSNPPQTLGVMAAAKPQVLTMLWTVDWGKPHTTPRQVYKWQCKIIHEKAQSQTVTLFVFGINHQVGLYTENQILAFPESGLRVSGGGVWVD